MQLAPTDPKDTKSLPNHKFACLQQGTKAKSFSRFHRHKTHTTVSSLHLATNEETQIENMESKDKITTGKDNKVTKTKGRTGAIGSLPNHSEQQARASSKIRRYNWKI